MHHKLDMTIIDVRTTAEFSGAHIPGSVNIPLGEVPGKLDEIKNMAKPIVLCCARGNRSGQAMMFLRQHGIDSENGGSWLDVNGKINK